MLLELLKYATSDLLVFIESYAILSILLYFLVNGTVRIISRLSRLIMVLIKGWPPSHLDADGDWEKS